MDRSYGTDQENARPSIPRPVWLLGWSSLFTDAATEMIYPLLPVYLSRVLGAGPAFLGIIEGVAEGVNSALKFVSGRLSDEPSRRKPITIAGYTLSSIARPFIGFTTVWTQVLLVRVLDRVGKGIRGSPRDAMLAQFATEKTRGRIFGFHRAMDHAGAVIGPLIATLFLFLLPGRYRLLFALTAIPGALAVATLFRVPASEGAQRTKERHDARAPGTGKLSGRFYGLMAILLIFNLGNSADAFLLLRLSTVVEREAYVPLMWSLLHVVKASLSVYGGALSDRIGRKTVIIAGWSVYAVVYVTFALATGTAALLVAFLVYGVYFGLAEGTEKALVADLAPVHLQGTAFGYYNAALGVGSLLASVLFGQLYERRGASIAFGTGALLATIAALMLLVLRVAREPSTQAV